MVTPTSSAVAAAATSTTTKAAVPEQGTSLTSDFETFLKMLTAQARYQDPLNPLDSAEYASQLAQFSTVEQAVRTNELLSQLVAEPTGFDLSAAASWIGKDVLAATDRAFKGEPLTFVSPNEDGATSAEFVVYDAEGKEVQRKEFDPEADAYAWRGVNDAGNALAYGMYAFHIERYSGEVLLSDSVAQSYSAVTEVRVQDGASKLVLADGTAIDPEDITAVR